MAGERWDVSFLHMDRSLGSNRSTEDSITAIDGLSWYSPKVEVSRKRHTCNAQRLQGDEAPFHRPWTFFDITLVIKWRWAAHSLDHPQPPERISISDLSGSHPSTSSDQPSALPVRSGPVSGSNLANYR
ncbi:hypothetical protein CIHG_05240 [Coccidioides immitis H538.4]|uniref:Uncharacterized protein n=1 Tax=Coccidioides immitis H538.4 TaxID=396776 RepID=A0A0J8RQS8_COCIT|nr:hypothetical protein CIHG_05240 [Coccidioides immitis H538.4]